MGNQGLQIVIGADISAVTSGMQAATASIDQFTETASQSFDELAASTAALNRIQAGIDQAANAAIGAGARFDTLGGRLPLQDFNAFSSSVDRLRNDIASGLLPQISRIGPALTGGISITGINNLSDAISGISLSAGQAAGSLSRIPAALRPINPAQIQNLRDAVNRLRNDIQNIRPAPNPLPPDITRGANQAATALTNVGRVAQDLPFGFMGIQNNLNPLLESFQRLRAETGSGRAAFAALGQSLIGPAGIGIALSVVSAAILIFQNGIAGFNKKSKEAKEAADELAKSIKSISLIEAEAAAGVEGQVSQVNALAAAVADSNKPYEERKRALEELKEINKNYFKDLELEDAATGKLTATIQEYTKALINNAIQKGFVDEIAAVAKEVAKSDDEIKKSRDRVARAQDDLTKKQEEATKRQLEASKRGAIAQAASTDPEVVKATNELTEAQNALAKSNDKVTQLLEQEAVVRDNLNRAIAEGLKFKDLDTEKTKKEQDFLKKQLDLLEKIRDAQSVELGNLFHLKDIDPAVDKLAKLEQQIGNLKLQIAVRDAQKAGLPPEEIEKLKQAVKQNTQKALSDLFNREALLLEGSPKLRFSQPIKVEIPNNLTFIHTNLGFSDAIINDAVSKATGLDKKIPIITLHEARVKLLGIKLTAQIEAIERINEELKNQIKGIFEGGLSDVFAEIGEGFGEAIATTDFGDGLKKAAQGILSIVGSVMQQMGRALIAAAIKIKILKETFEKWAIANPGLAILAGIGLVAAGAAIKNLKFDGPKFADGGIVTGPLIGQIGEQHRPEVVLPLDRLPQLFKQFGGDFGGGMQLIPIINNEGLYLAMKRGERSAGRKF